MGLNHNRLNHHHDDRLNHNRLNHNRLNHHHDHNCHLRASPCAGNIHSRSSPCSCLLHSDCYFLAEGTLSSCHLAVMSGYAMCCYGKSLADCPIPTLTTATTTTTTATSVPALAPETSTAGHLSTVASYRMALILLA